MLQFIIIILFPCHTFKVSVMFYFRQALFCTFPILSLIIIISSHTASFKNVLNNVTSSIKGGALLLHPFYLLSASLFDNFGSLLSLITSSVNFLQDLPFPFLPRILHSNMFHRYLLCYYMCPKSCIFFLNFLRQSLFMYFC